MKNQIICSNDISNMNEIPSAAAVALDSQLLAVSGKQRKLGDEL